MLLACSVHGSSPSCESVLDAFCTIDLSLSPNLTPTDIFAAWVTVFSTHMRFMYTDDGQYSVSIGSIYPLGYTAAKITCRFRRWPLSYWRIP